MRKIGSLFQKIKYELFIFVVLGYELCRFAPGISEMSSWVTTPYTLSYRFGFGSRFLIGSIIDLFTDYLSVTVLWAIIFMVCVVLIALVSLVGGRLIRRSDQPLKPFMIAGIVLFLASPASVSYLFTKGMFGRFETYHLLFVILAICAVRHRVLKWLIPVLCVVMVAVHQLFVFTYAPLLFVILLYEMIHFKFSKESVALFVVSALALSVAFFVFQFFTGNLSVSSVEEMMDEISTYSNVPVLHTMLWLEYFAPFTEATTATSIPSLPRLLVYSAGTLLLMSPLIVCFYSFWSRCRKAATDKYKKLLFTFMLYFPLIFTPAFILTVDWGRYIAPIFISNFALILYLVYHREPAVVQVAEGAAERYQHAWPKLLMLALYLTALGKIDGHAALTLVARVFETVEAAVLRLF